MKKRELNAVARSLVEFLFSRNNDISGYWGIGMLCAVAQGKGIRKFSFRILPGAVIEIYGCEISGSQAITERLVKHDLNSIECRMSFFEDGRYENGKDKYTCGLAIAVTQSDRTGMFMSHISCWAHDPNLEGRRLVASDKVAHPNLIAAALSNIKNCLTSR